MWDLGQLELRGPWKPVQHRHLLARGPHQARGLDRSPLLSAPPPTSPNVRSDICKQVNVCRRLTLSHKYFFLCACDTDSSTGKVRVRWEQDLCTNLCTNEIYDYVWVNTGVGVRERAMIRRFSVCTNVIYQYELIEVCVCVRAREERDHIPYQGVQKQCYTLCWQ